MDAEGSVGASLVPSVPAGPRRADDVELIGCLKELAAQVAASSRDPGQLLTDAVHCVRLALAARDGDPVERIVSLARGPTRARRAATMAATADASRRLYRVRLDETVASVEARARGDTSHVRLDEPPVAVLATELGSVGHPNTVLNVYRPHPDSDAGFHPFESQTVAFGAVGVALVLSALAQRRRADNLEVALASSRRIGAAIGVLMAHRQWTYDQAFDALREVSQRYQRKLREIAEDVVVTGTLAE